MGRMTPLDSVEISTGIEPSLSVIWLHGLGADGHDFEPIVAELSLPFAARFVFPHAPERSVTINAGLRMRAWYDIFSLDAGPEDEAGIRASAEALKGLIEVELDRGQTADRIVLAGFSQGGAVAMHTALRYEQPLAGLLVLSSYLPLAASLPVEKAAANARIPICMSHGLADPVIPLAVAERSVECLRSEGYQVEWTTYPMPHSVCAAQIRDLNAWLSRL